MKVFEVFGYKPEKPEIEFDLADDLAYFINADPDFYRHSYFPLQTKFYSACDKGLNVSPKAFKPIVIKAYEEYRKKFPIKELEEDLAEDKLQDVCEKLQRQESDYYNQQKKTKAEERKK